MDDYLDTVPVTHDSFNAENDIAIFMGPLTSMYRRIGAEELKNMMREGRRLTLLDVRMPDEYRSGHICGAAAVPVDSIEERLQGFDSDRLIIIYGGGKESAEGMVAADKLHTLSFRNVFVLDGGLPVWRSAGGCLELEKNPVGH